MERLRNTATKLIVPTHVAHEACDVWLTSLWEKNNFLHLFQTPIFVVNAIQRRIAECSCIADGMNFFPT